MNLDIVRGQIVAMHGYDCIVRSFDEDVAVLEYPNGDRRYEYLDDIAEQNEDLVILDDEDDW